MDVVTTTAQMTAEEFLALPYDEHTRMHNGSRNCVNVGLSTWTRGAHGRGWVGLPLDVRIDDRNVYEPDLVWYREGRAPRRGDSPPYPVPDLVVEVRSPSTWRFDIGRKKDNYELHGVHELWLVDTAADVVIVFRRSRPDAPRFDVSIELGPGEALTSPLLPGFSLAVSEIFELEP
jgi:Uma2 family endonuclease